MAVISKERALLAMRSQAYCEDCGWEHYASGARERLYHSQHAALRHARTTGHRVVVTSERQVAYEGRP